MRSLFDQVEARHREQAQPLAARMRPRRLSEFVGQRHFLGEGKLLWRLLQADRLGSVVFYGPPGSGKTTLARLLATESKAHFVQLSAVSSGVRDVRDVLEKARERLETAGRRTLLFIDEIHRFNKAQQDALLPDVEDGVVILVGATTENPFFTVNRALLSRSQVFQFEPLADDDVRELIARALEDRERGLGRLEATLADDAREFLVRMSDGDARRALTALEIAARSISGSPLHIDLPLIRECLQRRTVDYDANGDLHYDIVSALIKSIRGSDPDASLYWLARMLEGGEDIRFVCRRLVILASEDVGNADPHALPLAVATAQACELVGLPECQLNLSQLVTYLACAPKSNAATAAIAEARRDVREQAMVPVPRSLRDRHYRGAEQLGHGEGYRYAHDEPDGVASMDYLGVDREYYRPVDRGFERELAERLQEIRRKLKGGGTDQAADRPSDSESSGRQQIVDGE